MMRRLFPLVLCAPLLSSCAILYSKDSFPYYGWRKVPLDACIVDNPDFPRGVIVESLEGGGKSVFNSLTFLSGVEEGRGRCDLIFSFIHVEGFFLADDMASVYSGRTGALLGTVNKDNSTTTFAFLGDVLDAVKPGTEIGSALESERMRADGTRAATVARSESERTGQRESVRASLDSAEKFHPRSPSLLQSYRTALEDAGDDDELTHEIRARLIASAAKWRPQPTLPQEARERLLRGQALLKQGAPVADAAREVEQAVEIAPWWPEGYFNLGMLRALQKDNGRAIGDLKLYVGGAADGPRVRTAKAKIAELEADGSR